MAPKRRRSARSSQPETDEHDKRCRQCIDDTAVSSELSSQRASLRPTPLHPTYIHQRAALQNWYRVAVAAPGVRCGVQPVRNTWSNGIW